MKRSNRHLSVGKLGEALGIRYLKRKGFLILDTNYANTTGKRIGEIDIIAEYGNHIVFVEVKTRISRGSTEADVLLPEESITRDKLRKLDRIARYYLRATHQESRPYRFDALSILYVPEEKTAKVRHLEHIFF